MIRQTRNIIFFFNFLVSRNYIFFMFKQRKNFQFFSYRNFFLKIIDFDVNLIRLCCKCFFIKISYCINNNFEKYVKCVRLSKIYDLTLLNITR